MLKVLWMIFLSLLLIGYYVQPTHETLLHHSLYSKNHFMFSDEQITDQRRIPEISQRDRTT